VIAQLRAIRAEPPVGDRFTHRLVSRRMLEVYNSTGDHLPGLRRRYPYNPAFMHPTDLERIGVRPGDVVRIDSDHDFIYGVVETTTDVLPGVVSMAHACGGEPERDGEVRTLGSTTGRLVSVERDFEPNLRHPAPERDPGERPPAPARGAGGARVRFIGPPARASMTAAESPAAVLISADSHVVRCRARAFWMHGVDTLPHPCD